MLNEPLPCQELKECKDCHETKYKLLHFAKNSNYCKPCASKRCKQSKWKKHPKPGSRIKPFKFASGAPKVIREYDEYIKSKIG